MRFLTVDDEPLVLRDLQEVLMQAAPGSECVGFTKPREALAFAERETVDAAFLDIEMGSVNGLVLAKRLKDLQPDLHIIFVTSYAQYAVDAFALHATGYLLKPVQEADIRRELTFLYGERQVPESREKHIRVQTFGGFEVFVDEKILAFKRAKAKELFAYLVDRRGIAVTTREASAVLWEDEAYSTERKNYYQTILTSLRGTLKEAGISHVLVKGHNRLAIRPELLDCDSYRFLDRDPKAVNQYRRDYMICYSWAEFSMGEMEEQLSR